MSLAQRWSRVRCAARWARRVPAGAALAIAVGAAAGCDSPTVPERVGGYGFTLPGPEVVFHWDSGTRVRVFLGDEPATRAEALASAFDAAAQAWTAAAPLAEVRFVRAASAAGADVVIAWSDGPFPVETEGCPPSGGALGVTTFCLTPERDAFLTYPLVGGAPGDVRFLVTISPTLFENAVVLRRLVTHEIGHTLGLFQHSPNPPDLMFGGALSADVPTEADRATLFTLYHTESDL